MALHNDVRPKSTAQQSWLPGVVEFLASLVTVGAIGAIFLNFVGAHLTFFGDPVDIDEEEVRFYWIAASVLGTSVFAAFAAAWRRGATKAYIWHSSTALVGLIVALAFAVTQTGPPQSPQPEPKQPRPFGSVCHSGGDNHECVGG